uniref:Uncharacterized protein n=1 Tax=Petromyzon marinus TaxID=7757 RepID=S4RCD5_PETMA
AGGTGGAGGISAELEVKKLQELVRKLEQQNEQLRSRSGPLHGPKATKAAPQGPLRELPATHPSPGNGWARQSGLAYVNKNCKSPQPSWICKRYRRPYVFVFTKAGARAAQSGSEDEDGGGSSGGSSSSGSIGNLTLDEVELLDLASLSGEREEDSCSCWFYITVARGNAMLYASPVKAGSTSLSPLQWSRQVLDHPSPQMVAAKRSLAQRLDATMFGEAQPVSPAS